MNKEEKGGCKWDSSVNIILLIMFALVLLVMSFKGCSWSGDGDSVEKPCQNINNTIDSLLNDSVVNIK